MKNTNVEDVYPLSPVQQGMLFHSLYTPTSGTYVEQISFDLHGPLNIATLTQAWQMAVDCHPVLRTAFVWDTLEKPLQVVGRRVEIACEQQDWRDLSAAAQQERLAQFLQADRQRGFVLSKAPLMRLTLIRLTEATYRFIWSHHHLLLDGWSLRIIFQDVATAYAAIAQGQTPVIAPPRPYRDYIAWLQQQDRTQAEAFWRKTLKGFTVPTPLGIDQVARRSGDRPDGYAEQEIAISVAATVALQSLAHREHLTLNTLVQGAWALLLSRYSGTTDLVFGSTVFGRPPELAHVDTMVGLFINTLPIRVQVSLNDSLLPWLKQLQAQHVAVRQYETCPLVEIQGWSDVPRDLPLFESIVVFENYPAGPSWGETIADLDIDHFRAFEQTHYPLTAIALPGSALVLRILYDCRRFDGATIARLLGHWQTVLEGFVAHSQQRLSAVPLLTASEQRQLLADWNNVALADALPQEQAQTVCLHQLFEAQAARTPHAVAVVFEDEPLTYQYLNRQANQLAHGLQSMGIARGDFVAVYLDRALEMIPALLGILKAGAAYVPLDTGLPQTRIQWLLSLAASSGCDHATGATADAERSARTTSSPETFDLLGSRDHTRDIRRPSRSDATGRGAALDAITARPVSPGQPPGPSDRQRPGLYYFHLWLYGHAEGGDGTPRPGC